MMLQEVRADTRTKDGSFKGSLEDRHCSAVFCQIGGDASWILRVVIGVLLSTFVFGCNDPVRRAPISSCLHIDTTPINELLVHRGQYLSAPPDSAMSRKDGALVERYLLSGDEGLVEHEEYLEFLGLFHRLQDARRNHEVVKMCPIMIREARRWHSGEPGIALYNQNFCARAAFDACDYRLAMEYLDSSESGIAQVRDLAVNIEGWELRGRIQMRAEINSVLRRDREVMRLLLPSLAGWGDTRALRLAILRTYSQEEIPKQFERAIDSLNIANYEDAPPTIKAKADTLFEYLGKRKKIGWTRLFGVELVLWPPGEEPFFGFPQEAYAKEITESNLYREMYCLPSSKDSLVPIQQDGEK